MKKTLFMDMLDDDLGTEHGLAMEYDTPQGTMGFGKNFIVFGVFLSNRMRVCLCAPGPYWVVIGQNGGTFL